MFHLIGTVIWVVGATVVGSFLLNFFGYQVDWNYVKEIRGRCFESTLECRKQISSEGAENAKCNIACFEPARLIEKQQTGEKTTTQAEQQQETFESQKQSDELSREAMSPAPNEAKDAFPIHTETSAE